MPCGCGVVVHVCASPPAFHCMCSPFCSVTIWFIRCTRQCHSFQEANMMDRFAIWFEGPTASSVSSDIWTWSVQVVGVCATQQTACVRRFAPLLYSPEDVRDHVTVLKLCSMSVVHIHWLLQHVMSSQSCQVARPCHSSQVVLNVSSPYPLASAPIGSTIASGICGGLTCASHQTVRRSLLF